MGGFQKYPIPRYVLSDAWLYNRCWFRHSVHVGIPTLILSFLIYRGAVPSQTQKMGEDYYVDPQDYQSPKKLIF
ncbi:unnamed protein product [Paramecium sonneborni]|uniref:Uncharacterized protein n=1 Tax=Paramecium sonneborni TaxID=65129 RepID=A0A8S1PWU7_9CILI|nr:unnamed protein product [Paramecium sonneborni]